MAKGVLMLLVLNTRKLCGQNVELLNIKVIGTYSYHCARISNVKQIIRSKLSQSVKFLTRYLAVSCSCLGQNTDYHDSRILQSLLESP